MFEDCNDVGAPFTAHFQMGEQTLLYEEEDEPQKRPQHEGEDNYKANPQGCLNVARQMGVHSQSYHPPFDYLQKQFHSYP